MRLNLIHVDMFLIIILSVHFTMLTLWQCMDDGCFGPCCTHVAHWVISVYWLNKQSPHRSHLWQHSTLAMFINNKPDLTSPLLSCPSCLEEPRGLFWCLDDGWKSLLGGVWHGLCYPGIDWVPPPILPAIWVRPAQGSGEEQYISFGKADQDIPKDIQKMSWFICRMSYKIPGT